MAIFLVALHEQQQISTDRRQGALPRQRTTGRRPGHCPLGGIGH